MYYIYSSLRNILLHNTNVTSLVPSSNISLGYIKVDDVFPKISIFRIGGSSKGYLGYKTSPDGYRRRNETSSIQIDILTRKSIEELELIDDAVIKAIHSGAKTSESLSLSSNPSYYDPNYDAYRVTQTWLFTHDVED